MNHFAKLRSRVARSDSERGAILVLTALVMLLLLFIAAFATDLGAWYRQGEEQQRAADVSSLNGISAYDRGAKAWFADPALNPGGFVGFNDPLLTPAAARAAEEAGLNEALETIVGLLETSGLTFSTTPTFTLPADADLLTNDHSLNVITVMLIADDGTEITITRSIAPTGATTPGGDAIFARTIDVSVAQDGEQFFSNILRDAPTINRSAQALLSNCGALCNQQFELNPPFAGFAAGGRGDGFAPLLIDSTNDGDTDQVWAVNHHSDGQTGGNFSIVCIDIATDPANPAPCTINGNTSPYPLDYQTAGWPVEHVRGTKIYFPAQDGSANTNPNPSGIVCYDTTIPGPCDDPATALPDREDFYTLWSQTNNRGGGNHINSQGPFVYQDRMYAVSQHGQIQCITFDFDDCGGGVQNLSTFGDPRSPGLQERPWYTANGEQDGQFLYLTQLADNGTFFLKLDLSDPNGNVTQVGAERFATNLGGITHLSQTFFRFDTNQNPIGICVGELRADKHACVDLDTWILEENPITGLNAVFAQLGNHGWNGDSFAWEERRTFFSGGQSNRVVCWNWVTQAGCDDGEGSVITTDTAFHNVTGGRKAGGAEDGFAQTYAFAQISENCLIALGDNAIFYSFNPEGFTPCVEANTSTQILPCECSDGSGEDRYGVIRLPAELLSQVDSAHVTVTLGDGGSVVLPRTDVLANGGIIDLTGVDQNPPAPGYFLLLEVNAKIDPGTGLPFWQSPIPVPIEIDVQPTLTQ